MTHQIQRQEEDFSKTAVKPEAPVKGWWDRIKDHYYEYMNGYNTLGSLAALPVVMVVYMKYYITVGRWTAKLIDCDLDEKVGK